MTGRSNRVMTTAIFAVSLSQVASKAPAAPPAFAKCAACHTATPGASATMGPNLFGVVGNKAGSRPGFNYSPAVRASRIIWTKATIARFIADPAAMIPGTLMPRPAITAVDRDSLAAWLASLK
jgi:cytochrome c